MTLKSANAGSYMGNATWSFGRIAMTSVLSGNRKRKYPCRCAMCNSVWPCGGLFHCVYTVWRRTVKAGLSIWSCMTCVLFAQITCGCPVVAKFKVSTQILGWTGTFLYSWGKLAQKSLYLYDIFFFSKTEWMHPDLFLAIIPRPCQLMSSVWEMFHRLFLSHVKKPMPRHSNIQE